LVGKSEEQRRVNSRWIENKKKSVLERNLRSLLSEIDMQENCAAELTENLGKPLKS
jgi:hypothetical protein